MVALTLEELLDAAYQLRPEEKAVLLHSLQVAPPPAEPLPQEISDTVATLRAAGAFDGDERLFINPTSYAHIITDDELLAAIEDIASEWEPDESEFFAFAV